MRVYWVLLLVLISSSAKADDWYRRVQEYRLAAFRNPTSALAKVKADLQRQPDSISLQVSLAEILILSELQWDAMEVIDDLSRKIPSGNVELDYWFASIQWHLERYLERKVDRDEAIFLSLEEEVGSDQIKADSRFLRGLVYGSFRETLPAIDSMAKVLEINQSETLFHRTVIYLATLQSYQGLDLLQPKFEAAINYFEGKGYLFLLEIAYYNLALIHKNHLNWQRAIGYFQDSARLSEQLANAGAYQFAQIQIAECLAELNRHEQAQQVLAGIKASISESRNTFLKKEFYSSFAIASYFSDNQTEAKRALEQLRQLGVESSDKFVFYDLQYMEALVEHEKDRSESFELLLKAHDTYKDLADRERKNRVLERQLQTNIMVENKRNQMLYEKNLEQENRLNRLAMTILVLMMLTALIGFFYILTRNRNRLVAIEKENLQLEAEKQELKNEILVSNMKGAQEIQEILVNQHRAEADLGRINYACFYESADCAGGDWYGVFHDEVKNFAYFLIGDATGHSLAASLVTAAISGGVQTCFQQLVGSGGDLWKGMRTLVDNANKIVWHTTQGEVLMSFMALGIDLNKGEVVACNCGHQPFHSFNRKTKKPQIKPSSLLGFEQDIEIYLNHYQLDPGEFIIIFTDGLIENHSEHSRRFRFRKLRDKISLAKTSIEARSLVKQGYLDSLDAGAVKEDDCCFIILQFDSSPTTSAKVG